MSLESEKGAKKLVSVSATSTPVIKTREKAVETTKAIGKDSKESKGDHPEESYMSSVHPVPYYFLEEVRACVDTP